MQREALYALLADEILVVADGRLLQAGPRGEVFTRPASLRVARLLGIQNISTGTVAEPGVIASGEVRIIAGTGDLPPGSDILWTIRPDQVTIAEHRARIHHARRVTAMRRGSSSAMLQWLTSR